MTDQEYNEKIEEQWRYIEELKLLVSERAAIMGRPIVSCVVTFGCQMNARDSEKLRGILDTAGFINTDDEDEADLVIYNTCTVRDNADQHVYGRLGHLNSVKKKKPGMIARLRSVSKKYFCHAACVFQTFGKSLENGLIGRERKP
jgi:tRNA-2-methylthio-N6-dimethylallyladenosine synthase